MDSNCKYWLSHIIFIGIIVFLIAIVPNTSEANISFDVPITENSINLSKSIDVNEIPHRIIIPSANIDILVNEAEVKDGTWQVNEKSASYGTGSAYLSDQHGNTIIFAHARKGLFQSLPLVEVEDMIVVVGKNNVYSYEVTEKTEIMPTDIDLIRSYGDDHITLFTCDGYNDEKRLLVKARRIQNIEL